MVEIEKYNPCDDALDFRKEHDSFEDAWNKCHRGDWMLWIASRIGVDIRTLTLAKALCAKTVLHLMKDDRSKKAVEVAEMFGNNKATEDELHAAAAAAYAAAAATAAADVADAADAYAVATVAAAAAADDDDADAAATAAAAAADADAVADAADAYAVAAVAAADADAAADAADVAAAADAYAAAAATKNRKMTSQICREVLTKEVFKLIKE